MRRGALDPDIRVQFALKQLPHENQPAIFAAHGHDVAEQGLVESRGELGSEIAHLVGVRKDHDLRLQLLDDLPQRQA